MPLNPVKGNMYSHITHTWNPIRGCCRHKCTYCYMKSIPSSQRPVRLVESELKLGLGSDKFIFAGSSTDMFEENISDSWITQVLARCLKYPENQYLFQSKNPVRFWRFNQYPPRSHFATTIESNRDYPDVSFAPPVIKRKKWIQKWGEHNAVSVTIEPILDFDFDILTKWIFEIAPEWVVIGADSKGHNLPEPPSYKVCGLIRALRFHKQNVIIKPNLSRITSNDHHG